MSEITDAQLTEFCEKLKVFREKTLTARQRVLLDAILSIAWNATAPEESLESGFDGCFDPNQAKLILAYHPVGPVTATGAWVAMVPRVISGIRSSSGPTGIR
jgi:hypothetical protein